MWTSDWITGTNLTRVAILEGYLEGYQEPCHHDLRGSLFLSLTGLRRVGDLMKET